MSHQVLEQSTKMESLAGASLSGCAISTELEKSRKKIH
jgi:hypothetical protein